MRKIFVFSTILIVLSGVSFIALKGLSNRTFILYYHNVGTYKYGLRGVYISPDCFEKQMRFLSRKGYKTIGFDELAGYLERAENPPKKTFVITFDDGYKNNYENALPVLERYDFTATVFVPTSEVGKTLAHKRTSPEQRMSWKELADISRSWRVESHTVKHISLTELTTAEVLYELTVSRRQIEEKLGRKPEIFCYPSGKYNNCVRDLVKNTGYRAACITRPGLVGKGSDLYALPRVEWKELRASSFKSYWDLKWFHVKILAGV